MKVNAGQAPSTLIPEYIGSDFDKVLTIADNMETVTEVVDNLDHIKTVETNITNVVNVGANIEDVVNVSTNMDYVKDVAEGIEGLPVVSYIGDEPPTQPLNGAEWFCTKDGRTYTWYEDVDSGQWVESSPQSVVGVSNTFALWKRSLAEAGYDLIGSFQDGCTVTSVDQVVLDTDASVVYQWKGTIPVEGKVIPANSTPATSGGVSPTAWVDRTDGVLRYELLAGPLKLRNSGFALRDFVSIFDGFGVTGNGVTYDHIAISSAIESVDNLIFPPATYRLNAAIASAIGNNKKLLFMPGAKFISDNLSDGIMYFHSVGDGFSILGNPTLEYSSVPITRLAHTIYVRGESITNLLIDGPEIKNGANMAVAVFCGNDGGVAVGSKNITVCNIKSSNTLGDTVHIEGADSDVSIYNIYAENSGDDVVAVVNYTGAGLAPTHPSQTKRVQIHNVNSKDAVTSSISLGGVTDFIVDGVTEQVRTGTTCFTLKLVHDASYAVGNSDGVVSNVITDGATKIVALDTPAAGTAFNTGIVFDNIKGKNILDSSIFASNSDGAASGRLSDITIKQLDATLAASARPWYINNTKGFRLGNVTIRGGTGNAFMSGNIGLKWDDIELNNLLASASTAMTVITSSVDKAGNLNIDAAGRPVGLQYQSNSKTVHNGLWSVKGASTDNFVFGSNSNKSGWFGEVAGTKYIGASVSAGTTTDIVFDNPPTVYAGSAFCTLVSATSNEGGKWGYKNVGADKLTMVWSENLSFVFVGYNVKYRAV